jgi:anti-sigma factor ChrR (cupin superfamily)
MADQNFEELAILKAFSLLEEEENKLLATYLKESPELANELQELEEAVAAIAYNSPSVLMDDRLKERLFEKIDSNENSSTETEVNNPPFILRSHQLEWQTYLIPGITVATLYIDREKRQITSLLKVNPGIRYPLHRHAGVEELFMLEGDLVIDGEVCHQGDYIRCLPNSSHSPISIEGCLLLVKTSLDDKIIDRQ